MSPLNKDQALADWHQSLYTPSGWTNASSRYRYLIKLADNLFKTGLIDPMERFEMVELATGAYCHHVEETEPAWRNPAAEYDVYNEVGVQTGSVSGNRLFLHGPGGKPEPMEFFAQIHEAGGDRPVITRTYAHYGVFRDRYIYTGTGQRLTLVETGKMVDGVMASRLDDPDVYRSIIDAALIALEEGDMARYLELWERENFSIFRQCSRCCDRFEAKEDCIACEGNGFVENPMCPSRLPLSYAVTQV